MKLSRIITLCTGLFLLGSFFAAFAEAKIRVDFKDGHRRPDSLNIMNRVLRDHKSGAISLRQTWTPKGLGEDFLLAWALDLRDSLTREDGLNVSQECGRQLSQFTANLNQAFANMSSPLALFDDKNWSIKVIDSFGKIPSGILVGGFGLLGDYSECVGIRNQDWNGKYCQISNGFFDPLSPPATPLLLGICLTTACHKSDVGNIVDSLLEKLPADLVNQMGFDKADVTCQTEYSFDAVAIIAVVVIGLFVALALVATAHDIYKHHFAEKINQVHVEADIALNDMSKSEPSEKPIKDVKSTKSKNSIMEVVEVFSVYTNFKKLIDISPSTGDQVDCLNGIRVITLSWVILCHCYMYQFAYIENKSSLFGFLDRFSFNIIMNGWFAVDTFFLMSGFLACHLFLKVMQKSSLKITPGFIFKYYFHRYWRLTPVYLMWIFIGASLTPYLSSGPFHPGADGYEPNRCRKAWWTNLLYINNMGILRDQMCFDETWYLANDMQFYWISPLLLIPLASKNKKYHIASIFLGLLLLVQSFLTIALTLHANPASANAGIGGDTMYYMDKIYYKPWTRIQPFIVGIFLAYLLTYRLESKNKFKFNWRVNILLWIVSLFLMSIVLFGLHKNMLTSTLSINTHIIYQVFSRLTWSLGLAGVIFLCYTSNGYFINSFLSWSIWKPLAKLNYSAYLVHLTVTFMFIYSQKRFFYITDINMIWFFISCLTLSFVTAGVVSLLFEIPFIRMEKFFFKKK